MTIGAKKLAAWRSAIAKISKSELARRLDVEPSTVGRWELGEQRPELPHRSAIQALTGGYVAAPDWVTDAERARERQLLDRLSAVEPNGEDAA